MRAEDPVEDPRMQYQFASKTQTVHPAVPNSDTLVDENSCRPGLFKFFGRDHISYYITVRGPDILRNVIFLGYVPFYPINAFFVNTLYFLYWQNVFCDRVKWLRRSNLAPGAQCGEL